MGPVRDPALLDAVVQQEGVAALLDRLDAALAQNPDPADLVLREAVARSASILADDPAQLPAQLVGRLAGLAAPPDAVLEIRTLVERTRALDTRTWLCPRSATLTRPGAPLRRVLRGLPDLVTAVAVSPDGRAAVSGSYGRDVRVWDLDRGLLRAQFTGDRPGGSYAEGAGGDAIAAVTLVGDTVLAASADRCVYEIDGSTGAGTMVLQGETDNLFAVALSADGSTLVAGPKDLWGGSDYRAQVWDVRRPRRAQPLEGPAEPFDRVAVTPSGDRVAAASHAGAVAVWDTATRAVLWSDHAGPTSAMALSPDGSLLATGHEDGRVQVRRAADGASVSELVTGDGRVLVLAFVDQHRLVCGAEEVVLVGDLVSGAWTHRTTAEGASVVTVAATVDLGTLVAGCGDGATRCWDVLAAGPSSTADGTGPGHEREASPVGAPVDASVRTRVEELENAMFGGDSSTQHEVTAVAVAGRLALAASRHWTMVFFRLGITEEETHVRLWDTASGELQRDLGSASRRLVHGGHVDTFRCVALSADGSLAAAGSDDRTLRVWDTTDGRLVAAFTAESAITGCALSDDGTQVTATEASGRVHVLDLAGVAPTASPPRAVRLFPGVDDGRDPEHEQVERRRHVVGLGKKALTRTIEKYLERFGLEVVRLSITDDDGVCMSALEVEGHAYQIAVTRISEIGQVQFRVGSLLHATLDDTPADRIHGLLLALSVLNYRIPLGSLGYDPTDGEVALRYALPVTGGEVRYEDFEQVLVVLQNVLAKHAADLRAVVAGERTAQDILR